MKKILLYVFALLTTGLISMGSMVFAGDFLNQDLSNAPALPGLKSTTSYNVTTEAKTSFDNIMLNVKNVIDWVLGMLALVSVIILIYTGVKMLFNSGDDKAVEAGYKTAKNVFIALAFIAGSWIIVKSIFYVITLFTAK